MSLVQANVTVGLNVGDVGVGVGVGEGGGAERSALRTLLSLTLS